MLLLPLSHFIELLIDLIDGGGDVVQLSNGLAVGSTVFVAPPLQYTGNGSSNDEADAFSRSLWGLTGPSERTGRAKPGGRYESWEETACTERAKGNEKLKPSCSHSFPIQTQLRITVKPWSSAKTGETS